MELNINAEEALSIGQTYLHHGDYVNAKKYLEYAENISEDKSKATYQLFRLDLKTGNFKQARERLKSGNIKESSLLLLPALSQLEIIEFNFNKAREILKKDIKVTKSPGLAKIAFAKLDIQTGDFERARYTLERLQESWIYGTKASFELVYLLLLEERYKEARRKLNEVSRSQLNSGSRFLSNRLKRYISVLMEDYNPNYSIDPERDYPIYRATHPEDEEVLINHIERHKEERLLQCSFFEDTDVVSLLKKVKELLLTTNPNYFKGTNIYSIRFDKPIGLLKGEKVNDLTVVGFDHQNVILSMYPSIYSDEFDSEGYSKNLEFKQLREDNLNMEKKRQ